MDKNIFELIAIAMEDPKEVITRQYLKNLKSLKNKNKQEILEISIKEAEVMQIKAFNFIQNNMDDLASFIDINLQKNNF